LESYLSTGDGFATNSGQASENEPTQADFANPFANQGIQVEDIAMSIQEITQGWISLVTGEGSRRKTKRAGKRTVTRLHLIESLEARAMMAGDTVTVKFNIPTDVVSLGVYTEVSGTLTATYVNNAHQTLASGSLVYYDPTIHDYALATATSTFVFQLSGDGATIELPETDIKAGQIVIGIGSAPTVLYTPKGVSTPTASTNPYNVFGLFEYAYTSGGLDIDLSEVDQVGFPFTITTEPIAHVPAQDGVGITLDRGLFFDYFPQFIASQDAAAQVFQQSLTAGGGYRLLAPQNIIDGNQSPILGAPTYSAGGSLQINTPYYYWVTGTSSSGETGPSNLTVAVPYDLSQGGQSYPQATVHLNWNQIDRATGYNVYRSTSSDVSTARLIGQTAGYVTGFADSGAAAGTTAPPTNSYTFDPLNSYFNGALDNFFSHYETTGSFSIMRDGALFTGQTNTNYQEGGYTYTVLELESASFPGQTFLIFKPYFSTNTDIAGAPPPPSWMPHPTQSPAAMILACDGVFNTGGAQPGVDAGVLSDLENSIVSAFNRGIADTFSIAPSDWTANTSLYYAPGSTSNWYAAYLHQNSTTDQSTGVSINGLAYGLAYDDQGGDSTNFQGVFTLVEINIQAWGTSPIPTPGPGPGPGPGPSPTAETIQFLQQPSSGKFGTTNEVLFRVLGPNGEPVIGSSTVIVQVVGANPSFYSVITDPLSGLGSLTFLNQSLGVDSLKLSLPSGVSFNSVSYLVSMSFILPSVLTFGTPTYNVPGAVLNSNYLGTNALPATDVPNALPDGSVMAAATPWALSDANSVGAGGAAINIASLEAGQLGNLIAMARAGRGALPEQLPPPNDAEIAKPDELEKKPN